MTERPLVSVVIPAYNAAKYLAESVASVLAQTYGPFEILVCDDGSTDGTAEVAKNFGPPVRYFRQENKGPAAARNLGLRNAAGKYIAFLDADDLWHPRKLELQIALMEAVPDVSLCGTSKKPFKDGTVVTWDKAPEAPRPVRIPGRTLIVNNRFNTSTVIARASAVRETGEFDEEIFGPEDWDYWRRLTREHDGMHLEFASVAYRELPGSVSSNAARMFENHLKVLRKGFAENPGLPWHTVLRALSFLHFDATLEFRKTSPWRAAGHLARSLLLWPLPLGIARVKLLMRLRTAAVLLLGILGMRKV